MDESQEPHDREQPRTGDQSDVRPSQGGARARFGWQMLLIYVIGAGKVVLDPIRVGD